MSESLATNTKLTVGRCMHCGASLEGRVAQARYCGEKCKQGADNARRSSAKQEWARQNDRGQCEQCGATLTIGGARRGYKLCQDCRIDKQHAQRIARCHRIEYLWSLGRTLREIAAELGSTPNSIGVEIAHMRQEGGWDVPHRYAVKNGRRVAA